MREQPISADGLERCLAYAAIALLAAVVVALARGVAQWGQVPALIWAHLLTIIVALALTPVILFGRRGNRRHRTLGTIWVVAMIATAAISLFVHASGPGRFSVIHVVSVWTLIQVPWIWWSARTRRVRRHRRAVRGMVIGALLIAGFFTFRSTGCSAIGCSAEVRDAKGALVLALLVWLSGAWFGSWEFNPNNATRLFAAISLVEDHDATIDEFADLTIDKARFGAHVYLDKAPGMTLMALPAVWIADRVIGEDAHRHRLSLDDEGFARFLRVRLRLAAASGPALLTAIAAALLYDLALAVTGSATAALVAALGYALGDGRSGGGRRRSSAMLPSPRCTSSRPGASGERPRAAPRSPGSRSAGRWWSNIRRRSPAVCSRCGRSRGGGARRLGGG